MQKSSVSFSLDVPLASCMSRVFEQTHRPSILFLQRAFLTFNLLQAFLRTVTILVLVATTYLQMGRVALADSISVSSNTLELSENAHVGKLCDMAQKLLHSDARFYKRAKAVKEFDAEFKKAIQEASSDEERLGAYHLLFQVRQWQGDSAAAIEAAKEQLQLAKRIDRQRKVLMTSHRAIFGSVTDCLEDFAGLYEHSKQWTRAAELLTEAQAEATRKGLSKNFSLLITRCKAEDCLAHHDEDSALRLYDIEHPTLSASLNMSEKARLIAKHQLQHNMGADYSDAIQGLGRKGEIREELAVRRSLYFYRRQRHEFLVAEQIAPDCPTCKAVHSTKPIVYGNLSESLGEHEDHFSEGCSLGTPNLPLWRCTKCGANILAKTPDND